MKSRIKKDLLFFYFKYYETTDGLKPLYFSYILLDCNFKLKEKNITYLKNNLNDLDYITYNSLQQNQLQKILLGQSYDDFLLKLKNLFKNDFFVVGSFYTLINPNSFMEHFCNSINPNIKVFDVGVIPENKKGFILKTKIYSSGEEIEQLENIYNIISLKKFIKKNNFVDFVEDINNYYKDFFKFFEANKNDNKLNLNKINKYINNIKLKNYVLMDIKQKKLNKNNYIFEIILNKYNNNGFIIDNFDFYVKIKQLLNNYYFDKITDFNKLKLLDKIQFINQFLEFVNDENTLFIVDNFFENEYTDFLKMIGINIDEICILDLCDLTDMYSKNLPKEEYEDFLSFIAMIKKGSIKYNYMVRYKNTCNLEKLNEIYRDMLSFKEKFIEVK